MDQHIGHYRIVSELGRGGMGVVYKAHEESLNRFVAIKELGSHLAEDPSYVERFVREAQSAAKLNHPNIVQIYSISEHDGRHYFVMEYVSGTSVQQILRSEGPMDTVRATQIVLQAASGLEAAHSQGIIHRDIKPANLMIDERGLVKITDFGLAIALGGAARLTATGMMMGTPGYLSPEQCRDEGVDHRTDIYSLGVTFYEMLTGKMPFTASSPLALIRQIIELDPPDVRELNPNVDAGARDLLVRMMDKDPDQRFSDCSELIHYLQQDLASRGVSPSGPSAAVGAPQPPPEASASVSAPPPPPEASASVSAPPPPPEASAAEDLNVQPTVVVESGEAPPAVPTVVVESGEAPPAVPTAPVDPGTAPAVQPISIAPPPPTGRRRVALVAGLAVILVALGGLAIGVVAVWKLGLGDRIASLTASSSETDEPSEAMDQEAAMAGPAADATDSDQGDAAMPEGTNEDVAGTGESTASVEPSRPTLQTLQPEQASAAPTQQQVEIRREVEVDAGQRATPDRQPVPRDQPLPVVPSVRGVAVVAVGERLLASEAEAYLEAALARGNAIVIDESAVPSIGRLLGGEQMPPRGAVREALRPYASHLILVRAEYLGDRPLSHIGGPDVAFQARLHAVALDLSSGQMVGQALNRNVEYTHLTVERVVSENLRRWLRGVRASLPARID